MSSPVPDRVLADIRRLKTLVSGFSPMHTDADEIFELLLRLDEVTMSKGILQSTGIGRLVSSACIRQHALWAIREQSSTLVAKWRDMLAETMPDRTLQKRMESSLNSQQDDGSRGANRLSAHSNSSTGTTSIVVDESYRRECGNVVSAPEFLRRQRQLLALQQEQRRQKRPQGLNRKRASASRQLMKAVFNMEKLRPSSKVKDGKRSHKRSSKGAKGSDSSRMKCRQQRSAAEGESQTHSTSSINVNSQSTQWLHLTEQNLRLWNRMPHTDS